MNRRNFLYGMTATSLAGSLSNGFRMNPVADHSKSDSDSISSDPWHHVRDNFLMDNSQVYLNTGGLGPTLRPVLEAVINTMHQLQVRTNHGHNLIEKARPYVAKFVGCADDELAFTRNATEGNSTIASGLRLERGDEVIIDSHAHQGGSLAWLTRQANDGIVVKIFDPDSEDVQANVDKIAALITSRTRVVQVSHVTAPTGIRMPVKQIGQLCQQKGIWFHVDGAQSLGMFPFKVSELNCDSFAACCHKWMCGPQGTGVLFVKKERLDDVIPTEVGSYAEAEWDLPGTLKLTDSARRFECGTRDSAAIVGIAESARFLKTLGLDRIEAHGVELATHLKTGLGTIKGVTVLSPSNTELQSSMVSFTVDGMSCDEVFRVLSKRGLRCRPVRERGLNAVRVSTHVFNSKGDCDKVLSALKD